MHAHACACVCNGENPAKGEVLPPDESSLEGAFCPSILSLLGDLVGGPAWHHYAIDPPSL